MVGSYLRFFLGVFISLDVLRSIIFGSDLFYAAVLSVIYLVLTVTFFIWRF